ncbi:MAG: 4-(cytidine 5'-diphospho)-2-C-methyl-D-erythritol kinase, partial [Cytophagales bacterium]|nr:4-(cytidine 5'-diphospho)-2-C-methyl-D-erythritol kinase [Cytophagales bacterium]
MVLFPNAKINLGLHIISKRPDNYHNLDSCFYPIGLCDILEFVPSEDFSFTSSGLPIPGDPDQNLIIQAYHMLCKDFALPPVQIHLHKVIPMGAGLGGGSSDAAYLLKGMNEVFNIGLTETILHLYAKRLGSDCAFFINNKPTLAIEKGDV